MLQITYSKGIYTFTDGSTTYTFNINNGFCINTKTNKRVMQPAFLKQDILNALRLIYRENNFSYYANMLTTLYRRLDCLSMRETFCPDANNLVLLSILDKLFNVMPKGYVLDSIPSEIIELSNKQLVKVINYVREYNDVNNTHIGLRRIIQRLRAEELAAACGNMPIEFVEKYERTLKTFYDLGEEYRDIAFYYYYNQKLYALRTDTNDNYSYHYAERYILTYIKCCKAMKKQPIKTNNFMREYIETLMAYDIWQETSKNERFLSHYERYKNNLTFSYGNYVVVLPKSPQDLVTEGNEMHHCVGSYRDRVANGETIIVFIRHKDTPNKCYITAEIAPTTGKILQYYLAYDRCICSEEDWQFRRAYQDWLKRCNWW